MDFVPETQFKILNFKELVLVLQLLPKGFKVY